MTMATTSHCTNYALTTRAAAEEACAAGARLSDADLRRADLSWAWGINGYLQVDPPTRVAGARLADGVRAVRVIPVGQADGFPVATAGWYVAAGCRFLPLAEWTGRQLTAHAEREERT